MKKNNNKSLKRLKSDVLLYESQNELIKALNCCKTIIKLYPNSTFGYENYIRIKTDSYQKLIDEDELRELKNIYDKLSGITSKNNYDKLKADFNEYTLDCKESYNLKKIKREIIEQEFNKKIYESKLLELNKGINYINSYSTRGEKVTSFYDLINGILFFACLIFNLINHNFLLFVTVPFGIFGLIIIISFFTTRKKKKTEENVGERKKELIDSLNNDIELLKSNLSKANYKIDFLYEQKQEKMRSIPKTFFDNLSGAINDDEKEVSKALFTLYEKNNYDDFVKLLKKYTSLKADDYFNEEFGFTKKDVVKSISIETNKNIRNKILRMKKINFLDTVSMFIFMILSAISFVYLINNFNLNYKAFIVAIIVSIISMLSYDVEKGKHSSLFDTFSDNLIVTLFRSSLAYDLIYSSIHNGISLRYGFLQVPMVFICLLIGFVLIVSFVKYKHLYNKLMKRKKQT